jgi:two-component system copper resistance phosphate regulon response regulator CusR
MDELSILLVEDEVRIADTLRFGLSENGYEVEVAYDGQIGWRLFQAKKFNLLIVDINLPGITGYELTKMVRAQNANIPVIMLTALSSLEDKVEGFNAGADDYMVKPFSFAELILRVRALLKRTTPLDLLIENILRFADLEMNLDTKRVNRSGIDIPLTAKEFQLLEYLLRNKKRVVSRAAIGEHVWNIDFDTNTNTIEVYINYVRNKIDKPFPKKLIQTQVGMGYILKES